MLVQPFCMLDILSTLRRTSSPSCTPSLVNVTPEAEIVMDNDKL